MVCDDLDYVLPFKVQGYFDIGFCEREDGQIVDVECLIDLLRRYARGTPL
jgi:hypothetical protein